MSRIHKGSGKSSPRPKRTYQGKYTKAYVKRLTNKRRGK